MTIKEWNVSIPIILANLCQFVGTRVPQCTMFGFPLTLHVYTVLTKYFDFFRKATFTKRKCNFQLAKEFRGIAKED